MLPFLCKTYFVVLSKTIHYFYEIMESKGYSSLFALVDSHLSQTNLKENATNEKKDNALPNSSKEFHSVSFSDTFLFSSDQRLPIPTLSGNDSPIASVLAKQVSNMLKAKERKQREEEKLKLDQEMKKLNLEDNQDYVIDLKKAIQAPCDSSLPSRPEQKVFKSGSFESLFKLNITANGDCHYYNSQHYLPCVTDMSYILHKKIRKGKCSPFGKVLTSRLRPVAAPYLKEIFKSKICAFDFGTKSPCDLYKEKQRQPTCSLQNYNSMSEFMI